MFNEMFEILYDVNTLNALSGMNVCMQQTERSRQTSNNKGCVYSPCELFRNRSYS